MSGQTWLCIAKPSSTQKEWHLIWGYEQEKTEYNHISFLHKYKNHTLFWSLYILQRVVFIIEELRSLIIIFGYFHIIIYYRPFKTLQSALSYAHPIHSQEKLLDKKLEIWQKYWWLLKVFEKHHFNLIHKIVQNISIKYGNLLKITWDWKNNLNKHIISFYLDSTKSFIYFL